MSRDDVIPKWCDKCNKMFTAPESVDYNYCSTRCEEADEWVGKREVDSQKKSALKEGPLVTKSAWKQNLSTLSAKDSNTATNKNVSPLKPEKNSESAGENTESKVTQVKESKREENIGPSSKGDNVQSTGRIFSVDKENAMIETGKTTPEKSMSVVSGENPTELYEQRAEQLRTEVLASTKAISESIQLLHSSNKDLLKEPVSEVRSISHDKLIMARQNMETMARLVQAKVNLFKAVR